MPQAVSVKPIKGQRAPGKWRSLPLVAAGSAAGCALSLWIAAPPWVLPTGVLLAFVSKKRLAAAGFCALLAGLALGGLRSAPQPPGPIEALVAAGPPGAPTFLWVRGTVSEAEWWPEGCRIRLALSSYEEGGVQKPTREQVRAYLPLDPPLDGSSLAASLRLTLPHPATNPGEFDLERYLERQGISLVGSARSPDLVNTAPPGGLALLARYRQALRSSLIATGSEGGILLAILLGERGLIGAEREERLARSGLYHLVALSGFNVGLYLLLLMGLAHCASIHPLARDLLCLLALLLFGAVVAPRPSILRALLMAGGFLLARILARPQPAVRGMAWAAALLLALEPQLILDTGFQLTFLATLGILLLYRAYPPFLPQHGWAGALGRLLWVGLSAQLATLPTLVFQFQRLSLWGWLATPLASLPLLAIQAAGMLFMAGGDFVPVIREWLAWAMTSSAKAFLLLPDWLGGLRSGSLFLPRPSPLWLALYVLALVSLAWGGRVRRAGWVLLAFACAGAWAAPNPFRAPLPPSLVVLDVGQASCQILLAGESTVMVDAGNGSFRGPTSGRRVAEPFLARVGLRSLDALLLTHWDSDHAGSAPDLLMDLPVGAVAYPATDPPNGALPARIARLCGGSRTPLIPLSRGREFSAGGFRWEVLGPPLAGALPEENDRCLVLQAGGVHLRVLFTGDIGFGAERELLGAGVLRAVDVLLVPHHGSGRSSGEEFLERLRPKWGLISVGRANRFNHPSPAALERYGEQGVRIARTDLDGAILMRADGTASSPMKMRDGEWLKELGR